jgi:hypothetical protein
MFSFNLSSEPKNAITSFVALIKPVVVGVDVPTPNAPFTNSVVPLNVKPASAFRVTPPSLVIIRSADAFVIVVVPDDPLEPELPEEPLEPDVPELPEEPLEPDVPELPELPDEPLVPEEPDDPLEPDVPEDPLEPEEPLVPDEPLEPEEPEEPDDPLEPEVPEEPLVPDDPLEPELPEEPDEPLEPEVPEVPEVAAEYDVPLIVSDGTFNFLFEFQLSSAFAYVNVAPVAGPTTSIPAPLAAAAVNDPLANVINLSSTYKLVTCKFVFVP